MTTRVLAAVDALLTVSRAALQPLRCEVHDGPVPTAEVGDFFAVGDDADPDTEEQGVTVERSWAGIGANRLDEVVTVNCAFYVRDGGGRGPGAGASRVRARLLELFIALEAAVLADVGLGQPAPFVARLGTARLLLDSTPAGLEGRLTVAVEIATRTTV